MKYYFFVLIILANYSFAQSDFSSLGDSEFAVNHKISETYTTNFGVRYRYFLYQNDEVNFENRNLDLSHFSILKLKSGFGLGLGIMYRFRDVFDDNQDEFRLTQELSYFKKNRVLRFRHRLRLEERFFDDLTIWRTRYRLALDLPFKGEALTVSKGYFVAYMEGLYSVARQIKPILDYRISAQTGWLLSEKLKFQVGVEYRFKAININTVQNLFVLTSANLKI